MTEKLVVVVIEENPERGSAIGALLHEAADCEVSVIPSQIGLANRIAALNPDIVLIDVDNPTRDMLEELTLASGPLERPVAIFVSGSSRDLARTAISSGVSAYVVDGLAPERLKPIIDTAIARFAHIRDLRNELADTKKALEERKLLDRAKGILMTARNIKEDEAYGLLRKTAMDQGRRIVDVAAALVTASELLK